MTWHTFDMGGAAAERNRKAHLSHAVDLRTQMPLCGRVKVTSLVMDDSLHKPGEMPSCPICRRKIEQ